MKSGIYIAEVSSDNSIKIPKELVEKIGLTPGDKLEVLIKKIKTTKTRGEIQTSETDMMDIFRIIKNDEA